MMKASPSRWLVSMVLALMWATAIAAQPIVFHGDRDLAPFEFQVGGVPRGANVELAQAIGRVLDRPVEIRLDDWSQAQRHVREGAGDEALMFLAPTPERERDFDFTRSTVGLKFAVFVRQADAAAFASGPLATTLQGRRIGVTKGGYPRAVLEPAHPGATFVIVDTLLDGTRRLTNGDIDALAAPQWSQEFLIGELGIGGIVALPPFAEQAAGMAVRKGHTALQADLNRALESIVGSGEFDRIIARWSTSTLRMVSHGTMLALAAAAGVALTALLLLSLGLVWSRRQRRALEREVHERRKVERELLETQNMLRQDDQRKDEFIAMLGHELRNPLMPISTAVHMLARKGIESQQGQWALDIIRRQVKLMVRLIDDLLDVGRITSSKLTLQLAPVRLKDVVSDAVETVRPLIEQRRHALALHATDDAWWVHADRTRLTQVMANLLNNAAKYTPADGRVELDVALEGDDVRIRVSDNGIGIEPEQLASLFGLFHQEERAQPHGEGGMGIGLWLTRRLVEMHGGTIDVTSAGAGLGTTVTVHLPGLRCAQPVADPAVHTPAARSSVGIRDNVHDKLRVVVADDNTDSADVVSRLLETLGCQVDTVADGRQAVVAARRIEPRLVLLDIAMPHVGGLEACRQLRGEPWAAQTRFVAMSGFGSSADRAASLAAGFDDHMTKPVDGDALERLVASLRATPPPRAAL